MAVTGVILFLFVVGIFWATSRSFAGPERLNADSASLKGTGADSVSFESDFLIVLDGARFRPSEGIPFAPEVR